MTHSNLPSSANDLTEVNFIELRDHLRNSVGLTMKPARLSITAEGINHARFLAARDPEFARRVRAEFPQIAVALLGTST